MPLIWLQRHPNCNNLCLVSSRIRDLMRMVWLLLDTNNSSLWKMVKYLYIWARLQDPKLIMPAQRCKDASLYLATTHEWSRLWASKALHKFLWRYSNCQPKELTNQKRSHRPNSSTSMSFPASRWWVAQPIFRVWCHSKVHHLSQF